LIVNDVILEVTTKQLKTYLMIKIPWLRRRERTIYEITTNISAIYNVLKLVRT